MNFDDPNILSELKTADASQLNDESFGIVKMDHAGKVLEYNDAQSKFTGMQKTSVIGKHFFSEVAPCTNNFMVSQKYASSDTLDEKLDYTFTLRMAPTPVKLRMLKDADCQFLLVKKVA